MTAHEKLLWNKIQAFQLDNPEDEFTFSQRLARENGWHLVYAKRVIDEYKKFIFLCCITKSGVTPSDPVDQAWHLHLTYTKSYWVDFCRNTLEKEIHHNPTKGGKDEADKFEGFYTATRQLYENAFGHVQPQDIWQANDVRFSDIDFRRVNLGRYWLVKKPGKKIYTALFPIIVVGVGSFFIESTSDILFVSFMLVCFIQIIRNSNGKNNGGGGDSGCGSSCSAGGHHGCGHSGCGSGCSGCSASGCSGCGGGH